MKTFLPIFTLSMLAFPALAVEPAPSHTPVCASAEVKQKVSDFYTRLPSAPPLVAKRYLDIPEAVVASAIDPAYAAGTSGDHFQAVWDSMAQWPMGIFIFDKNGWVWKFKSDVPAFLGNVRKDEFIDVRTSGPQGLVSHLRPDLVRSIYAVELPGGLGIDGKDRQDATRAVIFYDDTQQSIFGVYASVAGDDIPRDAIPAFEKTLALIRTLPDPCAPR